MLFGFLPLKKSLVLDAHQDSVDQGLEVLTNLNRYIVIR